MKVIYLAINLLFIIAFPSFSQKASETSLIQRAGIGTSFNAVADEAIWGIHTDIESDLWKWRNGTFYLGISSFYGAFPNTTKEEVNQFIKTRTSLIQPVQIQTGHLLYLLNRRLVVRVSMSAGPSIFLQEIKFDDDVHNIYNTYRYNVLIFTAQSRIGLAVRIGKRNYLELYTNLPVINTKIAPLGIGLALNRALAKNKRH